MEINFIPAICKDGEDGPAKYKGSIVLRAPSFPERSKYRKLAGVRLVDGQVQQAEDLYSAVLAVCDHVPDHVVKVDIERASDKKKHASFDDLSYDPGCESAIYEMASVLMNGVQPGN